MTALRFGSVLVGWLAVAGLAQAAMYKWVDDQGVTQYTQYPPPDRKSEAIVPPPPPAEDAAGAQKKLEDTLQKLDANRKAQAGAEEKQQKATAAAEQRRKNCEVARGNLEKLTAGGRTRLMGPDGTTHLSEEDRQARIVTTKEQIKEFCD